MKTSELRTKKKQKNEANADEADSLIKEYLDKNFSYNKKTHKILEDYIKEKDARLSDGSE